MHPTSLAIRGGVGMAENKKITLESEKVEGWTYFQKGGKGGGANSKEGRVDFSGYTLSLLSYSSYISS